MMRHFSVFLAASTFISPATAQNFDAAAAFGAREAVSDVSLSPDGTKIAYISPTNGQGSAVYSVTIGQGAPKRILVASGAPERLEWCRWSSNSRLVCLVYFVRNEDYGVNGTTRLVSISSEGGDVKLLSRRERATSLWRSNYGGDVIDWLPAEDGTILMGRVYVPEEQVGSNINKRQEGFGVDRIDTTTLASKRIIQPVRDAEEFISDGQGNVRIMGTRRSSSDGYSESLLRYKYRKAGATEWEDLTDFDTQSGEGFNPYAVDATENVVYGFRKKDGRQALYKIALDGSLTRTLVYANPEVDVDDVLRVGKSRRVVGASYATDKRYSVYFDKGFSDLRTRLAKALPAGSMIDIIDASNDEQKLVLRMGSDINPGRYYLLDRTTKRMGELFPTRPELANVALAPVTPVNIAVSGNVQVPGYLTLPPGSSGKGLPAIVMPHGGPSARDEWGFDWLAQYYANRGYAVLQPNFRGSAGYGDNWLQINGFQSWKSAIGDVVDSGRWLVSSGIADPKKLAIVGWSYGGYAALQSGVVAPDLFKAIIAIAPVTDFQELRRQYRNYTNKYLVEDYIGNGPHVTEGSPAQNAKSIVAPVLMFHGTLDRNVTYSHATLMADKLKAAGKAHELVTYENLDHGLLDATARSGMLAKSDAFLRASLKLPPQ